MKSATQSAIFKKTVSSFIFFALIILLINIIFINSTLAESSEEILTDSINIGDPSTELGHNLIGWGPVVEPTGSSWGGGDDGNLRVVWYNDPIGPVGIWHMNENAGTVTYDETSNDNDGTIYDANWTTGKDGSALVFDGVDDYVDCGKDDSLDFSTGDFTISTWVKINNQWIGGGGSNDNISVILDKGTGHRVDGYGLHFSGNSMKIRFSTDGDGKGKGDTARKDLWNDNSLNYNQWYHIVALRKDGVKYLYIDGSQQSNTQTDARELSDLSRHLVFGKHDRDGGGWFNGTIDETAIWDRAISSQDVQDLHSGAKDPSDLTINADERWATVDMTVGEGSTATRLEIRALDGIADDSFEVYVDETFVYSYSDQGSTETWYTHDVDISSKELTGTTTIKIKSTGDPWEHFDTYGQLGISWIKLYASAPDLTIVHLQDSTGAPLSDGFVEYYSGGWKEFGTTNTTGQVSKYLPDGRYTFRMTYKGASISKKQDISVDKNVIFLTIEVTVKLEDSLGNPLSEGNVSFYAGGWKHFGITDSTGETKNELLPRTYTFRVKYDGASVSKKQDVSVDSIVVFSTINITVRLEDSHGTLLSGGIASYYSAGWKEFGVTDNNGETTKELLPRKYTFRITHDGASINKKQDVSADPVVVFSTIEVTVKLQNSIGNPLSGGNVSYYSAGWKHFGITDSNGETQKELLPRTYTFRMVYDGAGISKKQNIGDDPLVVFSTVNVTVKLLNSTGIPLQNGDVSYYSSGWKHFGITDVNGKAKNELLPRKYTFRMVYDGAGISKKQDVGVDPIVVFSTIQSTVKLEDSTGNPLSGGNASYYAGGWKHFGITDINGEAKNELLPRTYTFRMVYDGAGISKKQDISVNPVVVFSTIEVTVKLQDSIGNPLSDGNVSYYSSGWKHFGIIDVNGEAKNELLPRKYTFRMKYDGASISKKQDVSVDPTVIFSTINVTVKLQNSTGGSIANGNVSFYAGGWKHFGITNSSGEVKNELLPRTYTFRVKYDGASVSKKQDVSVDPIVVFSTVEVTVKLQDSIGNPLSDGNVSYYSAGWKHFGITDINGETNNDLLPRTFTFRVVYNGTRYTKKQNVGDDPIVIIKTDTVENYPPIADAGGSYSGHINDIIEFNASESYDPDGNIVNYTWDFGDGTKGYNMVINHSYSAVGNYTVKLRVTDDYGTTRNDTTFADITNAFSNDDSNSGTGGGSSSSHSYSSGSQSNNDDPDESNGDNENKKNIPPVAIANGPCKGQVDNVLLFDASESYDLDDDILQYRWDFDNDGIWDTDYSADPTISYVWKEDYDGEVTVEVKDEKGGVDRTSFSITVEGFVKELNELEAISTDANKQYSIEFSYCVLSVISMIIIIGCIILKRDVLKQKLKKSNKK